MDKGVVHYALIAVLIVTAQFTWCDARDAPGNKELTATSEISQDKDLSRLVINHGNSKSSAPSDILSTKSISTPGVVTVTQPPIPSAATATASPGENDVSKIINLLFAILLVVTAILMAITGACMFGLRRRYLIVSNHSKYKQLEEIP